MLRQQFSAKTPADYRFPIAWTAAASSSVSYAVVTKAHRDSVIEAAFMQPRGPFTGRIVPRKITLLQTPAGRLVVTVTAHGIAHNPRWSPAA